MTHGGVRWKTNSRLTCSRMLGTTCTAVAPVPSTATRSPVRSWSWFQCAVWKVVPSKRSRPGRSGTHGSLSRPGAATSTRAESRPAEVSMSQRPRVGSQVASRSSQSSLTWG